MAKTNKARKAFYDAILQRQKKISFLRSKRASQSGEDKQQTDEKIRSLEKQIQTLNKTLRENKVMKVKIKRSVLKQAVRQVMKQSAGQRIINQGVFVDKMKAKFGPNAAAFRKWIAQNWEQFERQIMPLVMGGAPKDPNVKQDVGMPTANKNRYGKGGKTVMPERKKGEEPGIDCVYCGAKNTYEQLASSGECKACGHVLEEDDVQR